jgi:hypothetical protein
MAQVVKASRQGSVTFSTSTISRMIAQPWAIKLPGRFCSIVSLTSGPISLAQTAKNVAAHCQPSVPSSFVIGGANLQPLQMRVNFWSETAALRKRRKIKKENFLLGQDSVLPPAS